MLGRLLLAATAAVSLVPAVGCSPGGEERPQVDIDTAGAVRGVIVRYANGRPVLDYGGEFRALLSFARVFTGECALGYDRMLRVARSMLPVGSRVWAVPARPVDTGAEHVGDEVVTDVEVFVFRDRGQRMAPTSAPGQPATVNERMVKRTAAQPYPMAPVSADWTDTGWAQPPWARWRKRQEMSRHDFGYWRRFWVAYQDNFERRVGQVGRCREERAEYREEIREREQYWQRRAEEEDRRQRRLVRRLLRNGGGGLSCDGDGDGVCYE